MFFCKSFGSAPNKAQSFFIITCSIDLQIASITTFPANTFCNRDMFNVRKQHKSGHIEIKMGKVNRSSAGKHVWERGDEIRLPETL